MFCVCLNTVCLDSYVVLYYEKYGFDDKTTHTKIKYYTFIKQLMKVFGMYCSYCS